MSLINDYLKVVGERSPTSPSPGAVPPMLLRRPRRDRPRPQWERVALGGVLLLAFGGLFWIQKNHRENLVVVDSVQAGIQKTFAFPVIVPIRETGPQASVADQATRAPEPIASKKDGTSPVTETRASTRLAGTVSGISGSTTEKTAPPTDQATGFPLPTKNVQKAIEDTGAADQMRSPAPANQTSGGSVASSSIVIRTSAQPRPDNQPAPDINDVYQRGLVAQQAGKNQRAAKYYHQVLKQAPQHLGALTNLSTLYIAQGKFAEARQTLDTIKKIDPQNTKALVNLGFIEIREQRYPQAKAFFAQALSINPSEETALVNLAYIAQAEHDQALAESYYEKILEYHPGNIDAVLNYASMMERTSRYDMAISIYKQCLKQPKIKHNPALTIRIKNRVELLSRYAPRQAKQ